MAPLLGLESWAIGREVVASCLDTDRRSPRIEKGDPMSNRRSIRIAASTLALAAAGLLSVPTTAFADTDGQDRREDRRVDRGGARDTRQEGRDTARDAKDACKEGDEKSRAECRQDKRDTKQDARGDARDIKTTD
jgi:hypothetical protein